MADRKLPSDEPEANPVREQHGEDSIHLSAGEEADAPTNRRDEMNMMTNIRSTTAIATVTPATGVTLSVRLAWEEAFGAYEFAKKEYEDFDAIHTRIMNECDAAMEAVPHTSLRPDPYCGRMEPVTTADRAYVNSARRVIEDLEAGLRKHEEIPELQVHTQLLRDVVAADDARKAALKTIRDRFAMDAANDKVTELADRFVDAEGELMRMPAPDASALLWKLEKLLEVEGDGSTAGWSGSYVSQTMADARRLLAGEGAAIDLRSLSASLGCRFVSIKSKEWNTDTFRGVRFEIETDSDLPADLDTREFPTLGDMIVADAAAVAERKLDMLLVDVS